ncbi:ATP-binding protein [Butyrivibrio sp. XPD2002]|uniref:ATP-binding protein n=1 Tax=Butyrivibrio sp. XPD2002 TaxID=1280665 RepID=UPI00040E83BE|nr:ATP-binding protein [Butyrivibrio sp. XPD2002]
MKRYHIFSAIILIFILLCFTSNAVFATEKSDETLVVGVPVDRCPVFYTDDNGEIVGIGVDLMRCAAEEAGYSTEFKPLKEANLKESLDNPEYDLIMPFGSAISSAKGEESIVSENLTQTPFTLVTVNNKQISDPRNLKVGMLKSLGGGAETVKNLYPGIEITLYDTMSECVSSLISGKVDALLHNSYVWSYVLKKPAYSNLVLHPASMFSMDFRAGTLDTPKGNSIITRLNEGIGKIPETRKQAIVLDYTTRNLYKYSFFDYIYQYGLIVGVSLLVVIAIAFENKKLRRAEKIAEDASKAKSMFLANMSHEIRTPINTIMGMGEMISRETTDNNIQQYAYSINRSATSLLGLVNDILDFSRMEAGKLKLRNEPYNLSSIITDVNVMIKNRAEAKGLTYKVTVSKSIPDELVGDETRLKQVIINLLTNAVKYTAKGYVHLTIDYSKTGKDTIDLTITVEDSGIGMKKSEIDRLFTAFERLDEDKNKTIEGTGLGMSIVKQILDAMNSTLEVHSVYGSGSTFSFTVSQKVSTWEKIGDYNETARDIVTKKGNYSASFIAPDAKVLIVDDTEINLTVITGLLAPTQMKIDTALSGKQALTMLENTKYDILLLDYRMPEMDGIELLNRIKGDLHNINYYSVCIVLTANTVDDARDMFIKAGFDEYLEKPVNGKILEAMLLKFLPADKILESRVPDESGDDDTSEAEYQIKSPDLQKLQDDGILDIIRGIEYAGSEELFIEALTIFKNSIDKKADEIEELYFREDITNYTIKVHALKSSANIIGAHDLSEKAKDLETAGKANDIDYIREHTSELLDMYCQYNKLLSKF